MNRTKTAFRFLLAILMAGAGITHFVNPGFFLRIMPPYLPLHLELVYLSGGFEIALGALLLVPQFSRFSAWGIIALLIAVFPANIYLFQNQELLPASPTVHLLRLLLQFVLILWAYWFTRPNKSPQLSPDGRLDVEKCEDDE
jgi:uncharacterized membrane protein